MTRHFDFDRSLEEWLMDGPGQLPDRVVDSIVNQLDHTKQRRPTWLPGRHEMNRSLLALGGIAATVALVVIAGAMVLGLNANRPGVGDQPSPSPTAMPSPTPVPSPTASPEPSVARPTSTPIAGLPEGPFTVTQLVAGAPAITVTIPAPGWRSLPQFEAIEKGTEVANLPEAAILFWVFLAGTDFYVPGDPCQVTSTKPDTPVTTVDEIATALAAQASRDASEPGEVTVGGYEGKSITLHVPDDAVSDECEQGEFISYGTGTDDLARSAQGPGQIDELWILDVDGALWIIDAMYRPDTPAELVEEMRTIVESATFETP